MAGKKVSPDLHVTPELTLLCDREAFLANENNKQAFIMIVSTEIANYNIICHQAAEDGDALIVKTAIELVQSVNHISHFQCLCHKVPFSRFTYI